MNKTNLLIDLGILTAFLVASEPHLTGDTIHEWLGIAFAVAAIVHILLHWNWIIKVGGNYFKKLFHVSRLKFIVDILMFVSMTAIIMSGIMISKSFLATFGIQLNAGGSWKMIHKMATNIALWTTAVHFALNWNWLLCTVKKYFISPLGNLFSTRSKGQISA